MSTMQFQPATAGGWVAITEGARTLVVGELPEPGFAASVWAALAEERGAQLTLDLLTARGISVTPPFALLDLDEAGSLNAIVRGAVSVTVTTADGEQTLDGSGVSTWIERVIEGVTGVAITIPAAVAAPGLAGLPLSSGTALFAALTLGRAAMSVAAVAPAKSAAPVPVTAPAPAAVPAPPVIPTPPVVVTPAPPVVTAPPAPAALPAPPAPPAPVVVAAPEPSAPAPSEFVEITQVADDDSGETIAPGAVDERQLAEADENGERELAADENPAGDSAADENADDDNAESDAGIAPQSGADAPVPVADTDIDSETVALPRKRRDVGDHDGHTVLSSDIAKLRGARKPAAPAPAAPAAPTVSLVLAGGQREHLSQPILVGRSPSVSQVSGGQMPRLLTVGGDDQDISRTHVRFALEGGTVVVTDLHSRNGTLAALPGKDPQKLRAGEPTAVIVGTVVDLGGGVTFTVVEA